MIKNTKISKFIRCTKNRVEGLKIDKNKIQNYGAVSSEIAKDMSIGVKKLFNSDISISTTGNVGPKLGDKSSSLGKVFIAINFNNKVEGFGELFNN